MSAIIKPSSKFLDAKNIPLLQNFQEQVIMHGTMALFKHSQIKGFRKHDL